MTRGYSNPCTKALKHYKKAARVNPRNGEVLAGLLFAQLDLSDWNNFDKVSRHTEVNI